MGQNRAAAAGGMDDPERVVGKEYMTAAFDSWIREASAELTLRKL